jgi:hypothetical protein
MAITEPAGAEAPAGLDELLDFLLALREFHAPARARQTEPLWEPARSCRCGPRAIPVADDVWYGKAWLRCVKCGRDVDQGDGT